MTTTPAARLQSQVSSVQNEHQVRDGVAMCTLYGQRAGRSNSSDRIFALTRIVAGRLKTLSQSFRQLDEDTRRSIQKARVDALESDNHGEDAGAGLGDDDEFYVDDEGVSELDVESWTDVCRWSASDPLKWLCFHILAAHLQTEKKSRAGSGAGGPKAKAASAQAMKKFSEKRARTRALAETVAAELGLFAEAADHATGTVDLAKARASVLAVQRGDSAVRVPAGAGPLEGGDEPARSFLLAGAGAALYPGRPLCSVCGFKGLYSCTRCGSRVCSSKCTAQHKETRCLVSGS